MDRSSTTQRSGRCRPITTPCCDEPSAAAAAELKRYRRGALLVVGIGNADRGDDAAGLLLGRAVADELCVEYLAGGEMPENYTAEMREAEALDVLFVDAVNMKASAGQIALISPEDLSDVAISTHKCSLGVLAGLLRKLAGKRVRLLGIQPAHLGWGRGISEPVRAGISSFVAKLTCAGTEALQNTGAEHDNVDQNRTGARLVPRPNTEESL